MTAVPGRPASGPDGASHDHRPARLTCEAAVDKGATSCTFSPPADLFGEQGLIVLIVIAVVLFGSTQIPKLARSLGSAQKEFKKGLDEGAKTARPAARRPGGAAEPGATGRRAGAAAPPPLRPASGRLRRHDLLSITAMRRSGVGADTAAGDQRWRIPFWALQVLELGAAFLLVTQSVHVGHGGILVGAGAVLAGLALTADGPLGIYRAVQPTAAPSSSSSPSPASWPSAASLPALRPDVEGLLLIGFTVVALVVLALRTTVSGGRRGRRRRRSADGRGEVIDATATVASSPATPTPPPPSATDSAARRAGRTAAAAGAAGRRAVDDHRPQVEEQVKRSIRGAGQAGRSADRPETPSRHRPVRRAAATRGG